MIREEVLEMISRVERSPDEPLPRACSSGEIDNFEFRTKLSVPMELRDWLMCFNGPCVGPGGVFGIRPETSSLDIETHLRLYPDWLRAKWIPVAGDGCGNYYVLDSKPKRNGNCPVYFIDTTESPTTPAFVVASDFWRFLHFLFKRELGEKGWPFDKDYVLESDPEMADDFDIARPWEV